MKEETQKYTHGHVVVVNYGMGNIHSIQKALQIYFTDVRYSNDSKEIESALAIVLPGDGAFPAAMENLNDELKATLSKCVHAGKALLGICIGFQILFMDSDEWIEKSKTRTPTLTKGLQLLAGNIRRFKFDDDTRIPHIGWNQLLLSKTVGQTTAKKQETKPIWPATIDKKYVYFIHSWRAENVPPENIIAYCNYNGDVFPAIVKKKNISAFQFHPEKSDTFGLSLLEDWAKSVCE